MFPPFFMISVIVPAYNEERRIGYCLSSLVAQRIDEPFEVIVVDNGSTDRTKDVARRFRSRLHLRIINEKRRGRGVARRSGFCAARGDILLSTDADAQLDPLWIATYVQTMRSTGAIAASGTCRIDDCPRLLNFAYNAYQPIAFRLTRFWGRTPLKGPSFAITREAYERSGGFSASLDAHEDVDLSRRVSRLGRIAYVKRPRTLVSGRRFREGLLRAVMEYVHTFIKVFWLQRQHVMLRPVA